MKWIALVLISLQLEETERALSNPLQRIRIGALNRFLQNCALISIMKI